MGLYNGGQEVRQDAEKLHDQQHTAQKPISLITVNALAIWRMHNFNPAEREKGCGRISPSIVASAQMKTIQKNVIQSTRVRNTWIIQSSVLIADVEMQL